MSQTITEVLERSQTLKEDGNKAFSAGQFDKALKIYAEALDLLNSHKQEGLKNVDYTQKISVFDLNICMCYYKLGKVAESLKYVDFALENNPDYVKAYYRKSVILKDMKNYKDSIIYLKRLLGLDPQNKEGRELLEQIRSQLVEEDNENKNPLLVLEKELKHSDPEVGLKIYQQYLHENIDEPEVALSVYQKYKLNEAIFGYVIDELEQKQPNVNKLNYLLSYAAYFYQTLFKPLLELKGQQPHPAELKYVEVFNNLSHDHILLQIFNKFNSLPSDVVSIGAPIHESFIKIFKFLRITNLSHNKYVEEATSLLKNLMKSYNNDKDHLNTVLATFRSCFRLNLACASQDTTHSAEIFDVPLVSTLEKLCSFLQDHQLTYHYESLAMGINLYLRIRNITKYEELLGSYFYKTGIAETKIVIYCLLLVNSDIGSKHFHHLLEQKWGETFLKEIFNTQASEFQRKLAFEILSLYLRDADGCKDLFSRGQFMESLIKAFSSERQPLFQLKITVLLVKIALRHPSEEVIAQFEIALNPAYLGSLIKFLIDQKDPGTILEFLELILGLSYVEDFKLKLSQIPLLYEAINKFIGISFEEKDQKFSENLTIILILINMLTDVKEENFEEQQKKYGVKEEDLLKLEEIMNRSNQIHTKASKYNHDYIIKSDTPHKILEAVNIESLCREILNISEFIKNSKLLRVSLPKLLGKLSTLDRKEKAKLIRRDIIRVCLLIWDNSIELDIKEEIAKFFSGILVTCNAGIFAYTEAIQIVDILAFAIYKSSHELTTFEATSSLVQFSSLNEDITNRILGRHKLWGTLILNLSEENEFIIHATLELINNLSLNEEFQTTYPTLNTIDRECIVLKALLLKYYENGIQPLVESLPLDQEMLTEVRLFDKYNSLFQKFCLIIGIPVFLNFPKELVAKFEKAEIFYTIFEDLCRLLVEIENMDSNFLNQDSRHEITDFLYKLSIIVVSQDKEKEKGQVLREKILEVAQKVLTPYIKEFSQTEQKKFNETISMLSS